jgi:hypothetical protein
MVGRAASAPDAPPPADARARPAMGRIAAAMRGRELAWPWLVVFVMAVVVLSWPIRIAQRVTVDLSWRVGLHQAAADGLRFGQDILFTYGPLGFLGRPTPFLGPTSALAFVATAGVYAGLIAILLVSARRFMPLWAAAVVTFLIARGFGWIEPFEVLQVVAFGLGVEVLRRGPTRWPSAVPIGAALLAGVATLGKLNVGVFIVAMAIAVVLATARPRWRGVLVFGIATSMTVLVLWLITGQQVSDLGAFARGSLDMISGYSAAMVVEQPGTAWIVATFGLVASLVGWLAWRTAATWPRDRSLALAALVVLLLFATWKYAFVRNNVPPAIVTLACATVFLIPSTLPRSTAILSLLALGLAFVGVAYPVPPGYATTGYLDIRGSAIEFARQARTVVEPWQWAAAAERSRQRLQEVYKVPPAILAQLDGHPVHIDPYQAAVAVAYQELRWRPMPIFQSYSAYTPLLDGLNADLLRSPDRPERILRQFEPWRTDGGRIVPYSVDGRFYWFESPAATIERLCRYREIATDGVWQVLAATGGACGTPIPLGTTTAAVGQPVQVPAAPSPNDLVVVKVDGIDDGPIARLRTAFWRSPQFQVLLDGFKYRLVPATAPDGLVLAVPDAAQGSPPFAFGPPVRTIEIRGSQAPGAGSLRYTFEAIPLAGP